MPTWLSITLFVVAAIVIAVILVVAWGTGMFVQWGLSIIR